MHQITIKHIRPRASADVNFFCTRHVLSLKKHDRFHPAFMSFIAVASQSEKFFTTFHLFNGYCDCAVR